MDRPSQVGAATLSTYNSNTREITLKQIQDQKAFVRQYCDQYMNLNKRSGDDGMEQKTADMANKQGVVN